MTEKTRNLLVGLTVIVAIVILGGMIITFQELPAFMQLGYRLQLRFPNASGATEGADVLLAGRRIGRVVQIDFTDGDARKGVTFTVIIDRGVRIPGDANAYVRAKGLTGGLYIDLVSDGCPPGSERKDPVTGGPLQWLPEDHLSVIDGQIADAGFVAELSKGIRQTMSDVIPKELSKDIRETMANLRRLTATRPATVPSTGPAAPGTAPSLYTTLAKLDRSLDAIDKTLGDKENQENLKAALANLKVATAGAADAVKEARELFAKAKTTFGEVSKATRNASKRFDDLAGRLVDDAGKLGRTLALLEQAAARIDSGKGTAGRLINDPALYESLLDATRQLKSTLETLQKLLAKWKVEGVKFQLK